MTKKKTFTFIFALMVISLSCKKAESNPYSSHKVKTIYLVRHASALHTTPDFDRVLDSAGRVDAARMGLHLGEQPLKPELILVSSAPRALETAELLCPGLGHDFTKAQTDSTLYACTPATLMAVIQNLDDRYNTVMVVGHNPATTQVANLLQNNEDILEVPTMGVVAIRFQAGTWAEVSETNASLVFFATPGNID